MWTAAGAEYRRTAAVVFLSMVFFQFIKSVYGESSGCDCNVQIDNLQDGANTDFGGVGWWQGLYDAFTFLIPILYAALQMIYQGRSESPFVTHQINMWISLIATCIYAFTFEATKKGFHHKTTCLIVLHIAFFSGALSTLSILYVLLSSKLALIFFVIWSLAFAFSTLKLIYCIFVIWSQPPLHHNLPSPPKMTPPPPSIPSPPKAAPPHHPIFPSPHRPLNPPVPTPKPLSHSLPPPTPIVNLPPHPIFPAPPPIPFVPIPSPPGLHSTVIVVVFISLGGLFFLAFLSVALCCFIKTSKKKMVQEKDIINANEHVKVQEAIIPVPHGAETVILTVEEDVHIHEKIKKNEKVGERSHFKLSPHHHQALGTGASTSASNHHFLEHKSGEIKIDRYIYLS